MKYVIDNNVGRKLFNDLQKIGFNELEYLDKMDRRNFSKFLEGLKGSVLITGNKELITMCRKRHINVIRMNPVATFAGTEECRPRTLRVLNKLGHELFRLWMITKINLSYIIDWTESTDNLQAHCDRMKSFMINQRNLQ